MLAQLLAVLSLFGASPGEPAVVWAVGDAAAPGARARRLARTIRRDRPDRFVYLGDVYETGTRDEFGHHYDPLYGPLAARTVPTPGNHEWGNRSTGYFPYWRAKLGRALEPWHALEVGGWELLSLNSEAEHDAGSPQVRWLEGRLAAREGNCRIAFWHRPRYSAGTVHGDAGDLAPVWDVLRGRAALVLNGHDHNSQRLRRRGGIVELVAGAGGRSRYGLNRRDRRLAWGDNRREAALRLVLSPGRARFEFRGADGRVLHSGAVRCSPAP